MAVAKKGVEEEVGCEGDNVLMEPTRGGGGRGALPRKKMQDQFSDNDGREQWCEHLQSHGVRVVAGKIDLRGKKIVMEGG